MGGAGDEEGGRPTGLTLWTDGSRDESGAVGYAVAWRKGQSWAGRKAHMGYYQEVYDAECAAIARALGGAADRAKRHKLGRVRIFTDAQAALKRMTTTSPAPVRPALFRRGKRYPCASGSRLSRSRSDGALRTRDPRK